MKSDNLRMSLFSSSVYYSEIRKTHQNYACIFTLTVLCLLWKFKTGQISEKCKEMHKIT